MLQFWLIFLSPYDIIGSLVILNLLSSMITVTKDRVPVHVQTLTQNTIFAFVPYIIFDALSLSAAYLDMDDIEGWGWLS